MGVSFMFRWGSPVRPRRRGLLETQKVEDGQDADGVEDGEADESCQLAVARAFPQGSQFPDALPDYQEDDC